MTKEETEAIRSLFEERIALCGGAFNETNDRYNLGRFEEAVYIKHLVYKLLK